MSYSPSSDSDEDIDMRDFLIPWKLAAGTNGLTCSPVRENVIICMNRDCERHAENGKGLDGHARAWKAWPKEWVVVHSFWDVEPSVAVHSGIFSMWSFTDLHNACYSTDDDKFVAKRMFGDAAFRAKLKRYCTMFEELTEVFEENYHVSRRLTKEKDLYDAVRGWSGAMEPLCYIHVTKKRVNVLTTKLTRAMNTVDIWKAESASKGKEIDALKRRVQYLNKKLANNK